jgi:transcriptional regulator with XRE-family HTH domain
MPARTKKPDPFVAYRLQTARRHAGFRSAQEACVRFGWGEPRYRSYESGTRRLTSDMAATYAAAFGVSLDWLFGYAGDGPELDPTRIAELQSQEELHQQQSAPKASDVAIRLRLARRLAEYRSASEAATTNGWSRSTYVAHESGQTGLSFEAARRYAYCFGVNQDWLLKGSPPSGLPEIIDVNLPGFLSLYSATEQEARQKLPLLRERTWRLRLRKRFQARKKPVQDPDQPGSGSGNRTVREGRREEDVQIGEYSVDALRALAKREATLKELPPIRRFMFPRTYLRDVLRADPAYTVLAAMTHNERRWDLRRGDRIFVDVAAHDIAAGGLFVVAPSWSQELVVLDWDDPEAALLQQESIFERATYLKGGLLIGRCRGRIQAAFI